MRSICISVVLVLSALFIFGCQGDPDSTGTPIFSLPGNVDGQQQPTQPTGPTLNAIVIEPDAINIEVGGSQVFKAYGYYSDNSIIDITGSVIWHSSNQAVGTINDKGLFSSGSVGWSGINAYIQTDITIVYSDYSFANVFASDTEPPARVENLNVQLIDGKAYLSWSESPEPNIEGYNIYRTRTSGVGYDVDDPLNGDDLILLNHFIDTNPGGGVLYYVVAAVNSDDVVGVFSSEVELDFNPENPWEV